MSGVWPQRPMVATMGCPSSPIAVVTETGYAFNLDDYVVDRVARVVRRDDSGNVLGEVRHYYDGPQPLGPAPGHGGGRSFTRRQEEIVLTHADATALYGAREPDWAVLGLSRCDPHRWRRGHCG